MLEIESESCLVDVFGFWFLVGLGFFLWWGRGKGDGMVMYISVVLYGCICIFCSVFFVGGLVFGF